jgi:hydrogenase maturation protease
MTGLVFGFGNLGRQDDGVAWHVLSKLMTIYGIEAPDSIDIDVFSENKKLHFLFQLQLLPELADELDRYDYAIFIDAHTGAIPNDINIEKVVSDFQSSPLTHHLTANSLFAIARQLNRNTPQAILVSIRGYEFEFSQQLSQRTKKLIPLAVERIINWINDLEIR